MPTTTTRKRDIPGVVPVAQRIVTRETSRTKAARDQTQIDVETFRQLSQTMKELKEEMESVRGRLLHTMVATQQAKLITTDGAFAISLKERSNWTYSDDLEDRMSLLKAEQQIEQRKGIAINNPTTYIDGRTVNV